jgi:hypothetical protein
MICGRKFGYKNKRKICAGTMTNQRKKTKKKKTYIVDL